MNLFRNILTLTLLTVTLLAAAQHPYYSGTTISNPYRNDGGLAPVIGVHNIQTMRASRSNSFSWTYNHQPMLAYWQGRFWMHFLTNPVGEHIPPGITMMQSSADGYSWTEPQVLFPEYVLPPTTGKGSAIDADGKPISAVMHQRVGWYVSSSETGKRLLAIGNYGVCLHRKDDPNDGNGIGRVVREVLTDGSLGPIYFIYYNHDYSERNTSFPFYKRSKDRKFRQAVEEILRSPLYWMQFVEECDRNDPHLPLPTPYKAFNYYAINDTLIAFWKHALTATSLNGGHTWFSASGNAGAERARGFVNSNAKIWGQQLTDGTYATVYNPSEFRWPLALSTSTNGLEYTTLNLIHGDITPMRYGGNYKSNGPQYVRGILPGNGIPTDKDMWVAYSVNKEDMWVSHIPVPIRTEAASHAQRDELSSAQVLSDLRDWNIYSPLLAPVSLATDSGGIVLTDRDPFDYAKAERLIPSTRHLLAEFDITPCQPTGGELQIEFCDAEGNPCSRITWQTDGAVTVKTGARFATSLKKYEAKTYHVKADVDLDTRMINLSLDGKNRMLYAPIQAIERIIFRTGGRRTDLTPDTPADRDDYDDLPNSDSIATPFSFIISNVRTETALPSYAGSNANAVLNFSSYAPYIEHFNTMEDENIAQLIPNSAAAEWMQREIPLFECPDKSLEELYYYRWWTLRKHIIKTNSGYAQTEFLVQRSYSDTLNLIACATSHHMMEARWLHNPDYAHTEAAFWLRGNAGQPLKKIHAFSSLLPYSLQQEAEVLGSTRYLEELLPDLKNNQIWWDTNRRNADGMYWQEDVQDGMEEQISGGKRIKGKFRYHQRPSINSYMIANKRVTGITTDGGTMLESLWSPDLNFFCTRVTEDSLAQVRELIGYLPWYCRAIDDDPKYAIAWSQLSDNQGFDAPFGMTTAEQRHPLFRKNWRGRPTCEWDGPVWPFATSQTLTALINLKHHYPRTAALVPDTLFMHHLRKYAASMHRNGRPYIGEYLDGTTGEWLWGDAERSRYYNHSTFADLIITGVCGIVPSLSDELRLHPLIADDEWSYFCLDGVRYHNHILTVIWDKEGTRYGRGKGLTILVDGKMKACTPHLNPITINLK